MMQDHFFQKYIGKQPLSFWITAALCCLSAALFFSSFFIDYEYTAWKKTYQFASSVLTQGIFVSAFYTLWDNHKVTDQIISLCVLVLIWGIYTLLYDSVPCFLPVFTLDKLAPFTADVFLSPFGIFLPGNACNFLNIATLGSAALFFLLFLAGSKSFAKHTDIEEAQEILFIHALQKRMLQAIGFTALIMGFWFLLTLVCSVSLTSSALKIWNSIDILSRIINLIQQSTFLILVQIFCPLYVILMVNKTRNVQIADSTKLTPYRYSFPLFIIMNLLATFWSIFWLQQILAGLTRQFSILNPTTVTMMGLISVYIYMFTKWIDFGSSLTQWIKTLRTILPILYLPVWALSLFRVVWFIKTSCLTPFQIWISFVLFMLGIFHIVLIWRKNISILFILKKSIALCLMGMLFIKPLSFCICNHVIDNFLKKYEAVEHGTLHKIPYPEKSKDLKKFIRAVSILSELDPVRLRAIFPKIGEEKTKLKSEKRSVIYDEDAVLSLLGLQPESWYQVKKGTALEDWSMY